MSTFDAAQPPNMDDQQALPPTAAAATTTTTAVMTDNAITTTTAATTTDDGAIMEAAIEAATDSMMELNDVPIEQPQQEQQQKQPPPQPPATALTKKKPPPATATTTKPSSSKKSASSSSSKPDVPAKKANSTKRVTLPTNKRIQQAATTTNSSAKKRKQDGIAAPQPLKKKATAAPKGKSTGGSSATAKNATTTAPRDAAATPKKSSASATTSRKKARTDNAPQTAAAVAAAVQAAVAHDDSSLPPPTLVPTTKKKKLCDRHGRCYTCYGCTRTHCEHSCTCTTGPNKVRPTARTVPPREKSTLPHRAARELGDVKRKQMIQEVLLVDDDKVPDQVLFDIPPPTPMRPLETVEDVIAAFGLEMTLPPALLGVRTVTAEDHAKIAGNPTAEELPPGTKRRYAATKRVFEQAVYSLAALLYPEHPQHLVDTVLRVRQTKFQQALQTVYDKVPRHTVQARTARAILVDVMPRDEVVPQFTQRRARHSAQRDMQAMRNGEILPTITVFPPDLFKVIEEIVQQDYTTNRNRRETWTDDFMERFKKHPAVVSMMLDTPSDMPSDESIKTRARSIKCRIQQQQERQNPLPSYVVKALEEWIVEDTSATKESLLERIKQLPPPPPTPPTPVLQPANNEGADGVAGGGGAENGQQQQEHQPPPSTSFSLPADEIVLQKIHALQQSFQARLVAFPKEIARRLEEWLILEPLATADELLARLKQDPSICQTTILPADTWIKNRANQIRSVLKHKWDREHSLPQNCYALLKEWIGKNTDTAAQVLLDRLKLDPSVDEAQLSSLPSLEICLKKIEILREKEKQQQAYFPKDAAKLLEQWLWADKTTNNDTLIERLRRDPSISQADLPKDDKRIRKKLEAMRFRLKGKLF